MSRIEEYNKLFNSICDACDNAKSIDVNTVKVSLLADIAKSLAVIADCLQERGE